ncbi:MAG: phosphatase PAP2-related protein [Patescibacteria group bacterium]
MQSLKHYFSDRSFRNSFLVGVALLLLSLTAQFFASGYANRSVSGSVTDIILSNTRVYDVDNFFIYGTLLAFAFVVYVCLSKPRCIPFIVKSIAIFTLIRAIFITLTHINKFPLHVSIESAFFQETLFRGIFTGGGLFFSGHTGLPFMLALIFWKDRKLRYIFLGFSAFFATVVLLGHLHYSIDVFSAFFITYSILHICIFLFKKDWNLFHKEEPVP